MYKHMQAQAKPNPSMERGAENKSTPLAKELLAIDTCFIISSFVHS